MNELVQDDIFNPNEPTHHNCTHTHAQASARAHAHTHTYRAENKFENMSNMFIM